MYKFKRFFWNYFNYGVSILLLLTIIYLWNPYIISFFNSLQEKIGLTISILALFGTILTSFNIYKKDRNKNLSDKDFVVIQIAGFYKRFENQYNILNFVNTDMVSSIIETLINVDKDIIISDHDAFYNNNFSDAYKQKITAFLLAFFEWKGYIAREHIGIFKELELLSLAEQKAMDILCLASTDKSISYVLREQLNNLIKHESTITPIEEMHSTAACMGHNLTFMFSDTIIHDHFCDRHDKANKVLKKENRNPEYDIIDKCFMKILHYAQFKETFSRFSGNHTILFESHITVIHIKYVENENGTSNAQIDIEFDNRDKYPLNKFDWVL